MKKLLLFVALTAVCLCLLASCVGMDENQGDNDVNQQPVHTHSFDEWDVTKNSTCTEDGEKVRYCDCGEKQTETIYALGHTEVIDAAIEATCTQMGLTEGKHCSTCDEVLVAQEKIPLILHSYLDDIDATCEVCGFIRAIDIGLDYTVNLDGVSCTVTGIGSFEGTELIVPEYVNGYKVTDIGEKAFYECTQLTKLVIPKATKTIGDYAFYGCTGLTEFTIPESVIYMGTQILSNADNITTIYYYSSFSPSDTMFLNLKNVKRVAFGGEIIPNNILENCPHVKEIAILDGVTSIGENAFRYCTSVISIEIPNSVTSIGKCAFYDCSSLIKIEIPDSVTDIGYYAFQFCTSLTSIEISSGVTSINDYVFASCSSLTSVKIPNGVTSIGKYAFDNCSSLTEIEIPDSVTSIGESAFFSCALLTSIEIPDGTTHIESSTFSNCSSLKSIVIPDSVTTVEPFAFRDCMSLNVYYTGSEAQWEDVVINDTFKYPDSNNGLYKATIHFDYVPQ